jgi:Flp pilus assembly protein CpaB
MALFGVLFIVIGLAGTVGTLYAMGVELPFLSRKATKPNHEGMVMVPMAVKAIPAYSIVTRDHILDPQTHTIALQPVLPESVRPEMILDAGKIVGRVLRKEKSAGYVFSEKDFYPVGTQPGITAGIPPGKRSFVFEAEKIHGMASLRPGDKFDILATTPHDDKHTIKPTGPVTGNPLVANGGAPGKAPLRKATVHAVVHSGIVLTPVTTRQVATQSAGLTTGVQTKMKPVQEITIAVDTSEVGPLSEALALDATLTCVARSGQPTDQPETRVEFAPPANDEPLMTSIETIVNGHRRFMTFPEPARPAAPAVPTPREQAPAPRKADGKNPAVAANRVN